jgi:hypothetical protein
VGAGSDGRHCGRSAFLDRLPDTSSLSHLIPAQIFCAGSLTLYHSNSKDSNTGFK